MCLSHDQWCLSHDQWCLSHDQWCLSHDQWCLSHDQWCLSHDQWCLSHDQWCCIILSSFFIESNSSKRAVANSIPHLLAFFQRLHHNDTGGRHIALGKSILNVLSRIVIAGTVQSLSVTPVLLTRACRRRVIAISSCVCVCVCEFMPNLCNCNILKLLEHFLQQRTWNNGWDSRDLSK